MAPLTARDVILEILRNAGGEWVGKTRLDKAFYFAHLYYANERPGLLTDRPIARMRHGPGIDKGDTLLAELVQDGYITEENIQDGPYPENRYRLTDKGRQVSEIPDDAKCAIEKATAFCRTKSAAELSQITHDRSRSWNLAKEGEILNIHIDTIPEDEYEKRKAELERLDGLLSTVGDEATSQGISGRSRAGVPAERVPF